jgi:predicted aldo/keto reductase-like oxidoreductase
MNQEAQVEENLRIAADARAGSLTAAEADLVARVGRKYREIMKVGCTGCGYCQPCPSGVDIPGAFDLFNAYRTFGKTREASFLYVVRAGGILSGQPAYASLCARCLECIEKCPQGLDIPDLLEQVAREFEGEGLREREAMARQFFA